MILDDQLPEAAPVDAPEPSLRDTIVEAANRQREASSEPSTEPETPREAAQEKPAAERKDGRDEQGRFAPKVDTNEAKPASADEQKPATDAIASPAEAVRPPPGWSPQSKADFDKLPSHIQADIAKREREVDQGFAKLSEYKEVEPFAQLAKQNGTTIGAALNNYRQFEVGLQQDFVGTIGMICQRFNVDPCQLAQVLGQRTQSAPQQQAAQPQTPHIDPQAIARQAAEAVRAQMESERVQQSIALFAADPKNIYFENVKPVMAKLIQSGLATTLDEAYQKACGFVPEVAALVNQRAAPAIQPNPRAAADQAQRAARATIGAPSAGLKPGNQSDPTASLRDTIVAARDAQVGRA